MKISLLVLTLSLLLSACSKEDFCNCLKKTDDEITETRQTEEFDTIILDNNVDVIIHPDTFHMVKVTCGKNLVDGIKTDVQGGSLRIRNINKCNWLRDFDNKFTVDVFVKELKQVTNYGSGNLNCNDTIFTEEFQAENWNGTGSLNFILNTRETLLKLHTGPADMSASGKTDVCYIYSAGNGYCNTVALNADFVYVTTKSTGDCDVVVRKELEASIEYNGDVFYSGNPYSIKKVISGSGKLIAR